ncbi:class I SAM-dependent methyltransferase [Pontibacter sp. MBLB2868]|uniref:class I SAM-dependent methyltransferase n=1 Tax=Pontibacter sp. MBLB2868 TaxID=3451555 RepID=UPI003F753573
MSLSKTEYSCNICGSRTDIIFDAKVLEKYCVSYLQCQGCRFIQTEKPYWLSEAYSAAITAIDVGLIYRNLGLSETLPNILDILPLTEEEAYLDYGGGYGLFVRIMRDKGYNFFLYDTYADNLFAKYFELKDYNSKHKLTAVTAFEVFEHLAEPVDELQKMLALSDTVIFSTELQIDKSFSKATDWWYFAPETGQHISFYTKQSIEVLADKFNLFYYSNGTNLHVLTKHELRFNPFQSQVKHISFLKKLASRLKKQAETKEQFTRQSLLQTDFELYKQKYLDELNRY